MVGCRGLSGFWSDIVEINNNEEVLKSFEDEFFIALEVIKSLF